MQKSYDVKHKCGHTRFTTFYGKDWQHQRQLEFEAAKLCPDCFKGSLEQRSLETAATNLAAGLPELLGSPKQVAWAESIRAAALAELNKITVMKEPEFSASLTELLKNDLAKWWIDNRHEFSWAGERMVMLKFFQNML